MATTQLAKVAVNLKLNNGSTASGSIKTATVSIGKLSTTNYDLDKAYAVAALINPCLTKALVALQEVKTSDILAQ